MHFRQHRILRLSFWLKLTFIIVEVIFAIIFAVATFDEQENVGAVFEWIIALVFTFYVLTFFIDLLPAARTTQEQTNAELMRFKGVENGGAMMEETANANGTTTTHGVIGDAYAGSGAGYDGAGMRQDRPPAAQNF